MSRLKTIEWINNTARIVDQTRLPTELQYRDITTIEEMFDAIKILAIRGAPAIGVAAAFGLYLGVRDFEESGSHEDFTIQLKEKADFLNSSVIFSKILYFLEGPLLKYT